VKKEPNKFYYHHKKADCKELENFGYFSEEKKKKREREKTSELGKVL
jgi:hypothetical protein